jgi:hypothetical protein
VRRHFIVGSAAMALAGGTLFGTRGYAHHGWDWADESENFELTGVIKTAQAVQRMGGRQRACCGLQRQPR